MSKTKKQERPIAVFGYSWESVQRMQQGTGRLEVARETGKASPKKKAGK